MRLNHFALACAILACFFLLAASATAGIYCNDGSCNFGETPCTCPADCGAPPDNEIPGSTCDDNIDNDCDGMTDGNDPDCAVFDCGNGNLDPGEECDGSSGMCPGEVACQSDCTCPPPPTGCCWSCDQSTLSCDGPIIRDDCAPTSLWVEDASCGTEVCGTGQCVVPPVCGDNVINQPAEQCDGSDDAACPEECRSNCLCPSEGAVPAVSVWGIAVIALLLLVGAKVYFTRRRTIPA